MDISTPAAWPRREIIIGASPASKPRRASDNCARTAENDKNCIVRQ
jgi:hypothetical protein